MEPVRPLPLAPDDIQEKLVDVPLWDTVDGLLVRNFSFGSFSAAMKFMADMAIVSERLDHHPTWTNTYQSVQVRLSTHDVGGLTELDFQWAAAADQLVSSAK